MRTSAHLRRCPQAAILGQWPVICRKVGILFYHPSGQDLSCLLSVRRKVTHYCANVQAVYVTVHAWGVIVHAWGMRTMCQRVYGATWGRGPTEVVYCHGLRCVYVGEVRYAVR